MLRIKSYYARRRRTQRGCIPWGSFSVSLSVVIKRCLNTIGIIITRRIFVRVELHCSNVVKKNSNKIPGFVYRCANECLTNTVHSYVRKIDCAVAKKKNHFVWGFRLFFFFVRIKFTISNCIRRCRCFFVIQKLYFVVRSILLYNRNTAW